MVHPGAPFKDGKGAQPDTFFEEKVHLRTRKGAPACTQNI
jgi:hypothetical protein